MFERGERARFDGDKDLGFVVECRDDVVKNIVSLSVNFK